MKMIVRRTALAVCTLVLAVILPTAASAACTGPVKIYAQIYLQAPAE